MQRILHAVGLVALVWVGAACGGKDKPPMTPDPVETAPPDVDASAEVAEAPSSRTPAAPLQAH